MSADQPAGGSQSKRPTRSSLVDLTALLFLAAAGFIIGLPIFSGGFATYMDNPAHLAEIHDLAGPARGGWSDLAFCGYPLGLLHSPLFFGLLSLWDRAGLPLAPAYAFFLGLSFCLPACALYAVCRRRAPPLPSACLAFVLMIQRPAILGSASAFGGMWTFYLAAAGLILLADRLARSTRQRRERIEITLLGAGIALTHLLVALTMIYLCLVHFALSLAGKRTGGIRKILVVDAIALVILAGLISAPYWLGNFVARGGMRPLRWDLTAGQILKLLVLPLDMKGLLLEGGRVSARLLYTDSLPLLALPVAGLGGAAVLWRRRASRGAGSAEGTAFKTEDRLPVYGISLSLLLLLVLLFVKQCPVPLLGISSWRQLYFVRVGFCLAAVPLLARWSPVHLRHWTVPLAVVCCLSGLWWRLPLHDEVPRPNGTEMGEVRELWSWLRQNQGDRWGRVYLQDTFMAEPRGSELAEGHVLAMTSSETGVSQLGAFYGIMPFPTAKWANDLLFAGATDPSTRKRNLRMALAMSNCTHLVLASPRDIAALDDGTFLHRLWRGGRFAVYGVPGAESDWLQPLTEGLQVRSVSYAPGRIEIDYDARGPGEVFMVKESYHPFWRAEGVPARIKTTASGLMEVTDLPAGRQRLILHWKPPAAPLWLCAAGCIGLLAWSFRRPQPGQ